jgi:preprotein translocase subunit SecE
MSIMSKIASVVKFYEQVKQEVSKVSWPAKAELVSSTILVIIVVLSISLLCLGVDYCINAVVQLLLKI